MQLGFLSPNVSAAFVLVLLKHLLSHNLQQCLSCECFPASGVRQTAVPCEQELKHDERMYQAGSAAGSLHHLQLAISVSALSLFADMDAYAAQLQYYGQGLGDYILGSSDTLPSGILQDIQTQASSAPYILP